MPTIEDAKQWYPEQDPVHGFEHILRVYRLSEDLARREGARWEIVRAAVLLHDAHVEGGERGNHHLSSAQFAEDILEKEDWPEDDIRAVLHCIRSHRFRDRAVQPETIEARVLFDADKLDAIGAVGVMRAVAYAVQHGQHLYHMPSQHFLETGEKEPGEPHTPYHEFHFKLRHLADEMYTESGRRLANQRHQVMTRFFRQLAAELEGES